MVGEERLVEVYTRAVWYFQSTNGTIIITLPFAVRQDQGAVYVYRPFFHNCTTSPQRQNVVPPPLPLLLLLLTRTTATLEWFAITLLTQSTFFKAWYSVLTPDVEDTFLFLFLFPKAVLVPAAVFLRRTFVAVPVAKLPS